MISRKLKFFIMTHRYQQTNNKDKQCFFGLINRMPSIVKKTLRNV